jgi:hypothetical protein
MIAERIAPDGFHFSPSGPKFSRKAADLTFQIAIQSDRNNIAGRRAAIWVHAGVYSRRLTAWQKAHPSEWVRPNAPFPLPVASAQLGYLREPKAWVDWDFADPGSRRHVADNLADAIRRDAGKFFAVFEGSVVDLAPSYFDDIYSPEGILAYLLATGEPQHAYLLIRAYLDRFPKFKGPFERDREAFLANGLPPFRASTPHDLAAFSVATGYPWA